MAEQSGRQPFRFRIPWVTSTAPPAPRPPPPPPAAAAQPSTTVRPPFRPPGVATPPRPPSNPPKAPPRSESRPPSPVSSRNVPTPSQPSPPSPIQNAPQPRVVSQPPSPSKSSPQQQARIGSRQPSPSLIASQPPLKPTPTPPHQTSQNPSPLAIFPPQASPQLETETQKSTQPQLIQSPKSPPQKPPRSSEPPPTRSATTPPINSEPPSRHMHPTLKTTQPLDETKEEKPISHEKEEKTPIPFENKRNQARLLELYDMSSDSMHQVVTTEEEKKIKKPAETNAPPVPHKEIRENIAKFAQRISDHTENITDENSVSVITLTGENTGATMKLGSESERTESKIHIHRGYKLGQEDNSEATTDGENNPKQRSKADTGVPIYINSNTQSINNSILMNSSLTEGNPGVHVVFNHYRNDHVKPNNRAEARKVDFNVTPSQKLTYEPTVKRRCLRGLMLESSDSDPENPDKPRRHGCRYDCKEK